MVGWRGLRADGFWSAPLSGRLELRLARLADLGERAFSIVLFSGLALRMGMNAVRQPWNLVILLPEGLVVLFIVMRRRPSMVSARPWDWLIALAGTAGPMMVSAAKVPPLTAPAVGALVVFVGLGVSIWGKLCLRRSFGLAAANRGVVQSGAYTFVRHPIYSGYLITYVGFFLLNPNLWNGAIYLLVVALMVVRIRAEEIVLGEDPLYSAFVTRTRYRLAPGIY